MTARWTCSLGRVSDKLRRIGLGLSALVIAVILAALSLMAARAGRAAGAVPFRAPLAPCTTQINSNVAVNTTWTVTGSPYCLNYEIGVNAGVTLTIDAGVTVYFTSQSTGLSVDGFLKAIGTPSDPITFTSYSLTPQPGDWRRIVVYLAGKARLSYCDVSYAGDGYGDGVEVQSSDVEIRHCRIHNNSGIGLRFFGNNGEAATITDSQIDHNTGAAVREEPGSNYDRAPSYSNLAFSANGTDALVLNEGGLRVNRTFDGPGSFNGSPILLAGHALYMTPGYTLTVAAGTTVQFAEVYGELNVDGSLMGEGTPTQPITFTSDSPTPLPGDWRRIIVNNAGKARLSYCVLGYTTEGLRIESSDVEVRHCRIHNNQGDGVYIFGSNGLTPTLEDTQIDHNGGAAIREDPGASNHYDRAPSYNNLAFSANGADAFVLTEGSQYCNRTFDGSGSFNGSPILLTGHAIFVTNGYTLTVAAGTTVQFAEQYGELNVDGSLMAVGAPTQPITFTSDSPTPLPGDWRRIIVNNAGKARLGYCDLGYTSEGLRIESSDVEVRQCRIHHSSGDGIYLFGAHPAPLWNNALMDNAGSGLHLTNGAQVEAMHTTLARNGVGLNVDGTAVLTNTILAANNVGVYVSGSSSVTLAHTLWDNNTTLTDGTVNETGHFEGPAAFAADGYHLTAVSEALQLGIDTNVHIDIDGEPRPLPASTAPDLGADECLSRRYHDIYLPVVIRG